MSTQNQQDADNGTPSVSSRDVSRNQLDHANRPNHDLNETSLQDHDDPEKQVDSSEKAFPPQEIEYREKSRHEDDDDDDDSSSSAAESIPRPQRPSMGSRQPTTHSIAAGHYVAPPVQNDVENQVGHHRSRSASNASTVPPKPETQDCASRVSTDAYGNSYPEGGRKAYLCVFGSFTGLMAALGMMNTIGTYQAYISTHQLQTLSQGTIGWIFGFYAFLSFFLGVQIGPIFDAVGPRYLVLSGSILLTASQLLLAESTKYWHFMLTFGLLGGTGTSLIFTPAIAAIGHHFLRRRGQFVGLAAVGGSFGGIVFPLILQVLFPQIGFAWSCRTIALINLILLIFANLFIQSRLPRKTHIVLRDILPDPSVFKNLTFTFTTFAVFFVEWGLFIPISYTPSYALAHGVNQTLSYQLLAVLNAGSCLGRYFPGLLADRIGRFNAMIITIAACVVFVFALWLPAGGSLPPIIIFLALFGFTSGSGISLTPVCVGQLCNTENLGRYYATCYTVASFATLTGIPIAGSLLGSGGGHDSGNSWLGLLLFTGVSYVAALACFVAARVFGVGWKIKKIY